MKHKRRLLHRETMTNSKFIQKKLHCKHCVQYFRELQSKDMKPAIPASKSEFWYGTSAAAVPSSCSRAFPNAKHSLDSIKTNQARPRSAFIPGASSRQVQLKSFDYKKPAIVERGLVKERAKLFEKKIEENKKMVEERARPRYCAPTVASKARQRPPLRELKPVKKVPKYEEKDEVLVMQMISNSNSGGQTSCWSWSTNSNVMQTSSSSNESQLTSRSSAKKVVASYSNCALAQKPVFTKKKSLNIMVSSSEGKSSISPLSETENKVYDYFDDEIDDQPDLTLNENESFNAVGTPASEFPPSSFATDAIKTYQKSKSVKKDGGESDARDLATEIFLADQDKDSSLNASLESLELDTGER